MKIGLIAKLLYKAGYVRKAVAIKEVNKYKAIAEELVDKDTTLEIKLAVSNIKIETQEELIQNLYMEILDLKNQNTELLRDCKKANGKVKLAEQALKLTRR